VSDVRRYYGITFGTTASKAKTMRVGNPDFAKSVANVRSAVADILASDIFLLKDGAHLAVARKAEKISVERVKLF